MSVIGFPLLLIPLAVCNIIIFLMPGVAFDAPLARLTLPSGTGFMPSIGDLLVALGVVLLLPEVVKGARPGAKYVTDHLLSLLLFAGALGEFLLLPAFGNATVLLLALLALVDFLSGLALRNRRRPAAAGKPAKQGKAAAAEITAEPEPAVGPAAAAVPAVADAAPLPSAPLAASQHPEAHPTAPSAAATAIAAAPAHSETSPAGTASSAASPQHSPPELQSDQPEQPSRPATPSAR
ncbi:MAG TPA: hypothetical protein VGC77_04000 [Rhodopseudomonas sp.]|uniref:hypothetical protein n=1 Tax=Rhodopseudomonas sp. TaxID=1078 RepID=UPI002ED7B89B